MQELEEPNSCPASTQRYESMAQCQLSAFVNRKCHIKQAKNGENDAASYGKAYKMLKDFNSHTRQWRT